MADDFVSAPASIEVTFDNGVTDPLALASPAAAVAALVPATTLAISTATATGTPVPATPMRRVIATRPTKAVVAPTPTLTPGPTETPESPASTDVAAGKTSYVDNGDDGACNGSNSSVGSVSEHVLGNGTPVANVDLSLFDSADDSIDVSPTDSAGYYLFPGLADGSYTVTMAVPTGFNKASTTATVSVASCSEATLGFMLTVSHYAYTDADGDADEHGDGDLVVNCVCDCNGLQSDTNAHADGYCDEDTHAFRNADGEQDAHSHTHTPAATCTRTATRTATATRTGSPT